MEKIKSAKMSERNIHEVYEGKWIAVVLSDSMFSIGDRIVVAVGDEHEWELLYDYVQTQVSNDYPHSSLIFGNPIQYVEDLICYTP